MKNGSRDRHADQPLLWGGRSLSEARLAVILVHGRGGTAEDILALAAEFGANDVAYAVPQAAGNTWYPYSFRAPIEQNEPGITSGMKVLSAIIDQLDGQGIPAGRVGILGFSQGACLALEFAARHARRYAAIIGLSGGLLGPPGTPRSYAGSFQGTPLLLGCSDTDQHVPLDRVLESADVFRQLDAVVDQRIYPGMGHTVNRDEVQAVHTMLTGGSLRTDL
jgi:predicted esterase